MQFEDLVALLPDYLDGNLNPRQQKLMEQELDASPKLLDELENIRVLHSASQNWQEEPTPEWHRTAFLARNRQPVKQNWMNWMSLATSVAAICLVLFRVEIVTSSEGVHIGFGQPTNQVAFKQQADQYLNHWQQQQNTKVSRQLLEFENQQLRRDQTVMATVLELNKEQRRKDLNQLTAYFVNQRNNDLSLAQTQYQELYDFQDQDREDIQRIYASLNK